MKNMHGASGGLQPHSISREVRMARVLAGGSRREFTTQELRIARHLAQEGASIDEIQTALHFEMSLAGFYLKLRRVNIRSRYDGRSISGTRAHLGGLPQLPKGHQVSMAVYRPRRIGGAE